MTFSAIAWMLWIAHLGGPCIELTPTHLYVGRMVVPGHDHGLEQPHCHGFIVSYPFWKAGR